MVGTTLAIVIGLVVIAVAACIVLARSVGRLTQQVQAHLIDEDPGSLRLFAAERDSSSRSETG